MYLPIQINLVKRQQPQSIPDIASSCRVKKIRVANNFSINPITCPIVNSLPRWPFLDSIELRRGRHADIQLRHQRDIIKSFHVFLEPRRNQTITRKAESHIRIKWHAKPCQRFSLSHRKLNLGWNLCI